MTALLHGESEAEARPSVPNPDIGTLSDLKRMHAKVQVGTVNISWRFTWFGVAL
jgi:hypothetical protein